MRLIIINYCVMPVPDQVRDGGSGIQNTQPHVSWIPAFAGMTIELDSPLEGRRQVALRQ